MSTFTSTIPFTSRPHSRPPSLSTFVCSAQALSLNSRVLSGMYLLYNRYIYYILHIYMFLLASAVRFGCLFFVSKIYCFICFAKSASKTRRKASETNVLSLVFHIFQMSVIYHSSKWTAAKHTEPQIVSSSRRDQVPLPPRLPFKCEQNQSIIVCGQFLDHEYAIGMCAVVQ